MKSRQAAQQQQRRPRQQRWAVFKYIRRVAPRLIALRSDVVCCRVKEKVRDETKKRLRNNDFTQTHFNLCEESLLETSADELSARLARSNTALIGGAHATTSSTLVKQSQSTVSSAGRSLFQQLQSTSKTTTTTTTTVFKYVFISCFVCYY